MKVFYRLILAVMLSAATVAEGAEKACDKWAIFTDFGLFEGAVHKTDKGFAADENGIRVETEEKIGAAGVTHRRTVIRNMGKKPFAATCLLDVFRFEGGDFEVYTQANTWMNESRGAWQPLHTCVEARCGGMRTSYGAAPVLALWNRQTGRGRVFHLMSDAMWEMRAAVVPGGQDKSSVAVEVGMDSRYLRYVLKPGEEVAMPEVVYYDFTNKTDLDCHKLHAWWNDSHPCRTTPTIYNTWLCRFDKLDFDFVMKQVKKAGELGLDYFVIDAGWFGAKGSWVVSRGDWKERSDGWLGGLLAEISKAVRTMGMKFGLWIEAETAAESSEVFKAHPEYFRRDHGGIYLDFTRDDARGYLHSSIDALVEKYGVEFIKFDFNCDAKVDDLCRDFADYNAGYRRFVREVRERHPGIYLEGCASGGLMMDLGWARDFDSFWLSDNQSPVHGLRIAKDTMLRLPPSKIERWITARSAANLQPDYFGNDERLLVTEDAWWREVRSVAPDFVAAFTTGGPVGFSCDLTALSEKHTEYFRKMVAGRKKDAAFWGKAVGRVLCDSPEVVVLQYSDAVLKDVRVVVATGRSRQNRTTVRPVLDVGLEYEHKGQRRKGAFWMEHGVAVGTGINDAKELRFAAATGRGTMPDVDVIRLGGNYAGHLQDVWREGKYLYWAHTQALVKTDLSGKILAKVDVDEHHAGLEVRGGKVYVAVCAMTEKTGGKTLPDSRVTINVYDAKTLKLLEEHVTDINDRSGSLAILGDGTFLVGCLRPPDITKSQVRFHHLDRNYKLINSHVLDNVPVELGIETIKQHKGYFYLCHYTDNLCIKLDGDFKEVARYNINGTCGLVFDGDDIWVGVTRLEPETKRWVSSLNRIDPPSGF